MLFVLLGCTEAIWYPQVPPVLDVGGDTAVTDTGERGELPCSAQDSPADAVLEVENIGVTPQAEIYWRDPLCDEYAYHTLLLGDAVTQQTFEGHVWVARDAGGGLLSYVVVGAGTTRWEVSP